MMVQVHQLQAIQRLQERLERDQLECWLFGGWAVDFHARRVTRRHDDIDIAVWWTDWPAVHTRLVEDGWVHAPEPEEDGYTSYRRDSLHLDVAFLERDDDGVIYTPLRDGRGSWPRDSFPGDILELENARARVVSRSSLLTDKSIRRDDPSTREKDRADLAVLTRLR
jgi:hypothetical protein